MLTDPIADMLTRIRNANKAMHDSTQMPSSRMKEEIARLLDELHAGGGTVVLVTHNESLARRAERVVRLRDGRIEAEERP